MMGNAYVWNQTKKWFNLIFACHIIQFVLMVVIIFLLVRVKKKKRSTCAREVALTAAPATAYAPPPSDV